MSNFIVHIKVQCFLESDFIASCSGTPFNLQYFPKIVGK